MGEPAQHHHAGADGLDARRQPLVRQRLPRREHRDRVAEHAAQFGGQIVGLPPGGGDDEQRTRAGQRARDEHPRAGGPDHGEVGGSLGGAVDEFGEGGSGQRQLDEPRHRGLDSRVPRCGHDASILRGRKSSKFRRPPRGDRQDRGTRGQRPRNVGNMTLLDSMPSLHHAAAMRVDPAIWPLTTRVDDEGRLCVGDVAPQRSRRPVRHPGLRARRGRLPLPHPPLPRRAARACGSSTRARPC